MDRTEPTILLKRDALGRVTLPREQREALIAEFERTRQKGTEANHAEGIKNGTSASWV